MFERLRAKYDAIWADRYGVASLAWRVLVEEGAQYWRTYLVNLVLMTIVAACTSFSAYLVGYLINATYLTRNFGAVVAVSALIIAIFTVKGLATYGQAVLSAWIAGAIGARNQRLMFDKLMREKLGFFAGRPSSHYVSQITYGARATADVLNLLVNSVGRDALSLIGLTVVMVVQDPLLSCVALIVMPAAFLSVKKLVEKLRNVAMAQFTSGVGLLETLQEALQGLRVVKAFGMEAAMRERVAANVEMARQSGLEFARLANRSGPLMEGLGGIAVALAFVYGGYRVIEMNASGGAFVSFMTAFLLAYEPAKRLMRVRLNLDASIIGVRMLYQLLDAPASEPEDDDKPDLRIDEGRIEFNDVEFGYRPNEPVLRGLRFTARAGRVTALVGESGGGKSTCFSLLLRFYEPSSGAILIDGQDISTVRRQSLRDRIAYVSQDVFLFRASVADNIAVGKPGATEDEIIAAAKAAHAHDFITAFQQGYRTPVGEHGLELSAGQRQRIAVARALLRDAPIILLDEPTSALDVHSEREVQRAIAELCAGRTTLVIAHRLHTVAEADRINVVEKGAVVESGHLDELLRIGQRYAAYHSIHFQEPAASLKAV